MPRRPSTVALLAESQSNTRLQADNKDERRVPRSTLAQSMACAPYRHAAVRFFLLLLQAIDGIHVGLASPNGNKTKTGDQGQVTRRRCSSFRLGESTLR